MNKIYKILDKKYSDKQKLKLKKALEIIVFKWNKKNKYTQKIFYLIQKIFYYL